MKSTIGAVFAWGLATGLLITLAISGCEGDGEGDSGGTTTECEQGLDPCGEGCIGADGVCSPEDRWIRSDVGEQDNALYVYTADMDGDGAQDMLVTSSNHDPGYLSEIVWYRNEGKGDSWTKRIVSAADNADPVQACNGITARDFNLDGIMDIAVACGPTPKPGLGGVYLFWGPSDADGEWTRTDLFEYDGESFFKIYPADMNGDGYDDVVAGGSTAGLIAVNPGDSSDEWVVERLNPETGGGLHVEDMDGDGTPEIINANAFAGKVILTRVSVTEGVFSYTDTWVADLPFVLDVHVLDANEDGNPDILASRIGSPGFRWFENPGDSSEGWVEHMISETYSCTDIFVGDMNGDGRDDVIVSGLAMMQPDIPPANFAWFENALRGGDVEWTMHYVDYDMAEPERPGDVALADLNGDEKLDVASTTVLANTAIWYENNLY